MAVEEIPRREIEKIERATREEAIFDLGKRPDH